MAAIRTLQKSILHRVFGVFAIPGNVVRETENLIFVAGDKFFECSSVAGASGCDKLRFVFANDARGERMRVWRTHEVQLPPDHEFGCGFAAKYSTKHLMSSPVGPFGCWARGPGFRKVVVLTPKKAMPVSSFIGLRPTFRGAWLSTNAVLHRRSRPARYSPVDGTARLRRRFHSAYRDRRS